MPDGSRETESGPGLRKQFQPRRLAFDTSSQTESNPGSNTMTFAGHDAKASLPPGYNGYQVVHIDPNSLSVVESKSFANTSRYLYDMADYINSVRTGGDYVAVQNIGPTKPFVDTAAAGAVADALAATGANPHLFQFGINKRYAFLGGAGAQAQRGRTIELRAILVDDTTNSTRTAR